jgi:hypothetical protein
MKKIKIRFVQFGDLYYVQKKTLFGWKYITYHFSVNGEKHDVAYFHFDKEELLSIIVKDHYGLSPDRVKVEIDPEIIKTL